jgi:peptidoglycan/LPS O-acetylase OafA/YrhL
MLKGLLMFVPWVCYSISVESKVLNNKITKWLSSISLEIYLAQSLVYLAVGKTIGNDWAGLSWKGFFLNWIMIAAGCIVFVMIWKVIEKTVSKITNRAL